MGEGWGEEWCEEKGKTSFGGGGGGENRFCFHPRFFFLPFDERRGESWGEKKNAYSVGEEKKVLLSQTTQLSKLSIYPFPTRLKGKKSKVSPLGEVLF